MSWAGGSNGFYYQMVFHGVNSALAVESANRVLSLVT